MKEVEDVRASKPIYRLAISHFWATKKGVKSFFLVERRGTKIPKEFFDQQLKEFFKQSILWLVNQWNKCLNFSFFYVKGVTIEQAWNF